MPPSLPPSPFAGSEQKDVYLSVITVLVRALFGSATLPPYNHVFRDFTVYAGCDCLRGPFVSQWPEDMSHPTSKFIGILAAIILAAATPQHAGAQARDVKLTPDQVYTNGPSKFQFPPTIATFQRDASFVQF